jgi:hypothetical protein
MERKQIRINGMAATVLLMLADVTGASAFPIAPVSQSDAASPTLVRMGGGGRGGYHGGGARVGVRNTNVAATRQTNVNVGNRTNVSAGRRTNVKVGGGTHVNVGGGTHVNVGGGTHVKVGGGTNVVVGRGGYGYYSGWRRPYAWAPGGAIAAGAAIGFMTAATAAAVATSAAPRPGMCWYYTDVFQTSGFWDVCP